jgi:hypothetical protein
LVQCALKRLVGESEIQGSVPRALDMNAAASLKKVTVLPVLCFARMAVTTLSYFCAANILKTLRPDVTIDWLPALLVSTDVTDQAATCALARSGCKVQVEKVAIKPEVLVEYLRDQLLTFKRDSVKFLFINVFTTDATTDQLSSDKVLHSVGLRACWMIAQAVRMLRVECGSTSVAEWTLLANAKTAAQTKAVSSLFGEALGGSGEFERYKVLTLNSSIVTNPIGLT